MMEVLLFLVLLPLVEVEAAVKLLAQLLLAGLEEVVATDRRLVALGLMVIMAVLVAIQVLAEAVAALVLWELLELVILIGVMGMAALEQHQA
jgi:hypothetical protein